MPWLTKNDFDRWEHGKHFDCYEKLGAHANAQGTWFAVWAPYADSVSVIGDFNDWDESAHPMKKVGAGLSGLWEVYVRGCGTGGHYKYRIRRGAYVTDKTDPYAFAIEPPAEGGSSIAGLSSRVVDLDFEWTDETWIKDRKGAEGLNAPVSIYEVHLGSWIRTKDGWSLNYRDIAKPLAEHVHDLGFTHVELMPVAEHPYYGSWGYQVVGYFAPTHRFGQPKDFMYLVNYLHEQGIGVILDWVPAHFAADPQGLVFFDGHTTYEYSDPLMRYHPDWGTYVFDYGMPGVRNFLISNAAFWFDKYHIDGLRVDAVASMLYRDYSRQEWRPNQYGGRENLEAISLLKETNEEVFKRFDNVMMIAEESTAWPGVSAPTYAGGLGFLYKWNMGWMHDTLEYMRRDPVHRKYHHNDLTFPLIYAFAENFILPLSHDEVVHGKGSLWSKMPGDDWQKAANLRLLYGHMFGHPGKKLLFMGAEVGQYGEWSHDGQVQWELLKNPLHAGIADWVRSLNRLYRTSKALTYDKPEGFEWVDFEDRTSSIVSYIRKSDDDTLVFVFNFTPVPRSDYRLGVPKKGTWKVVLNSNQERFGGSGYGQVGSVKSEGVEMHGRKQSVELEIPPLGLLVLRQ